jgi:hypothetical protein
MISRTSRLLLLGASLAAVSSPLTAQWIGPTRTFESPTRCASGILEYGDWPWTSTFPLSPSRNGTAYCSTAYVTLGQRANSNLWFFQVDLRTTVPESGITVTPWFERLTWLDIPYNGTSFVGASVTSPWGPLTSLQPFDVMLIGGRLPGYSGQGEGNPYDVQLTGLSMWAQWEIIGNHGSAAAGFAPPYAWAPLSLTLVETTAPEPSTWVLMATGLLTIGGVAARRNRARLSPA